MSEIEKRDALGRGAASAGDDVEMEEEKQANDDDEDNSSDDEDPLEVFEQQVAAVEVGKQASASDDSIEKTCKDELKRYIEASSLPIRKSKHDKTYNDPLGWRKKNQSLYPILASLAKIYLSVQATSAPSERIFSAASRLISNKRTTLNPEMAGKTLFVAKNWKNWQDRIDYKEAVEKADNEDNEE
ncbi:transposon protein [Seminavis robusta]|uniref:Transposon protein n=1 Tax=Seminavis robusta TaxID=568900 RepID=A0A9N8DKA3_9STRA|nr:transposon protein [Seminavis robusta]|eukprot:Sro127_g060770.1 transposon protein (186) ;mRNA; r:28338-28895